MGMTVEVYNKIVGIYVEMCKARIHAFIKDLLHLLLSKVYCSEVEMSSMRGIVLMQ